MFKMPTKINLHLLFFCAILCQGIFITLSDKDTSLSSNSLVRKRRVIADETVNYIVRIYVNHNYFCQGAILTHHTVISVVRCSLVQQRMPGEHVRSGGTHDGVWDRHNVTEKRQFFGNGPHQAIDGILLLFVDPPFVYNRNTGNIALHAGPLPGGTPIQVFVWELVFPYGSRWAVGRRLHSVTLPVISHEECSSLYHHNFTISQKHICTVQTVSLGYIDDIGGPLVINNRLAGIQTWKGVRPGQINPDIFVNLQLLQYNEWIRQNTR